MSSARLPSIIPGFPHLLHGGDWNPDQWLDRPAVIEEDYRLMSAAGVNALSVAIFAWAALEPEEGRYEFAWLDRIMDRLAKDGRKAILATPSGSKPAWMSLKYPEVCRVKDGHREPHQRRHNHCFTSPVYRDKVTAINTQLAERYRNHPALGLWHLSNEYGGDCQCDLCWTAFREFLKQRHGDLAGVNRSWYTAFWGHTFSAWEEINHLDHSMHAMVLDWKRFVTAQTTDFIRTEAAPLRRLTPGIPLTTNFMGCQELDYRVLARELDVVSWDSYPEWHNAHRSDVDVACETAFWHDHIRGTGDHKPWLLMESTPSYVNWRDHSRPKVPGMHRAASLQAVAHGADSVLYFQWRKSRGCMEKMHGAVVDHVGHGETRVFREVAALGASLQRLDAVVGLPLPASAAIIYDLETQWALDEARLSDNRNKDYLGTCTAWYRPLWQRGIAVDLVDQTQDLGAYKLVIVPMPYLLRPGFSERLSAYVAAGGTVLTTYLAGTVDEHDQCFGGGFPGPLRTLFGVWSEETDTPVAKDAPGIVPSIGSEGCLSGSDVGLSGSYAAKQWCDIIHDEGATVVATYTGTWYAGQPAVTRNRHGTGAAWYVAARSEQRLIDDLVAHLAQALALPRAVAHDLPAGVITRTRGTGAEQRLFVLNFSGVAQQVALGLGWRDAESGEPAALLDLGPYDARVLAPA
jgi:beta-galactosidase